MRFFEKGILIPEGLGLVVAVIGIVILGFLGFKLYNMFVDQDLNNAKSFINGLNSKIENLGDGENNTFALRGVEGWVLVAWNESVPIAEDNEVIGLGSDGKSRKPQKCFDKNCLCLCKDTVANCQENGYCRGVDRDVRVLAKGDVDYGTTGGGSIKGGKGYFSAECLLLNNSNLMSLFVSKDKNLIRVDYDYGLIKTEVIYNSLTSDLGCYYSDFVKIEDIPIVGAP